METKNITLKLLKVDERALLRNNAYFVFEAVGFIGIFRIHYYQKHEHKGCLRRIANQVYFEADQLPEGHNSKTFAIENMVDALIFLERKKQWVLEQLEVEKFQNTHV